MDELRRFHLAIPVRDLASTRAFYGGVLGCREARAHADAVTFDFFGHQLVCHVVADTASEKPSHNPVDGHDVPIPHFGMVLEMADWEALAATLRKAGTAFVIEPTTRFRSVVSSMERSSLIRCPWSGSGLNCKALSTVE